MDFIIDTTGANEDTSDDSDNESHRTSTNESNTKDPRPSVISELLKDFHRAIETTQKIHENKTKQRQKVRKEEVLTNEVLDELRMTNKNIPETLKSRKRQENKNFIANLEKDKQGIKNVLEKSVVLKPEFEKLQAVPPAEISDKKLKQLRKKEREKTKGSNWFGLPATEMTEEIKRDLEIIQMRSVLDPKHFYKKNDLKVLPKYFQVGKVMDSPLDFYNNRLTKKDRKKTLVDELMADAEFQKYNKRKFKEIIEEKQKTHYKAWRQAKRLKKRK